jgi:Leucine-rich repeat (LRR) protein
LVELILSENDFIGEIPAAFNSMPRLEVLSIHQHSNTKGGLQGRLPTFYDCYLLQTLHLNSNSLTGELPDYLLRNSEMTGELIEVNLSNNQFEGEVPSSWDRFGYLSIDLSDNFINGVPGILCEMTGWQGESVDYYNCDSILCDIGTYSALGRNTPETPCEECEKAFYMGQTQCGEVETDDPYSILRAFFISTNGPEWNTKTNWLSHGDICQWYGISCDGDGSVVKLVLEDNGLKGTPSQSIFKLSQLNELDLQKNEIDFDFDGIEEATNLEVLYLSNTQVSSMEGIGMAVALKSLHMTNNYLSGAIPNELFYLKKLEKLHLNFNKFNGHIPKKIGQLSNLENLYLMSNELSGQIPATIGKLTNLKILSLAENMLYGSIPEEINEMRSLEILSLQQEIPISSSGERREQRKRRMQENTGLFGPLPSFDKLRSLQQIFLGYNSLTGSIPYGFLTGIEDKSAAVTVDLESNSLSGMVPSSLTQFDDLEIYLSGNKFNTIAPGLCSMNKWLDGQVGAFSCNAILCPRNTYSETGRQYDEDHGCFDCPDDETTPFMGSLFCMSEDEETQLEERAILEQLYHDLDGLNWVSQENWFNDKVSFCDWDGITCSREDIDTVQAIELPDNGLSGTLPETVFDLPNLQELNLAQNDISLEFSNIKSASKLRFLNLDSTGLTSVSGLENAISLVSLHMKDNNFSTFPSEVTSLTQLQVLYLSDNQFNTMIPSEISKLSSLIYFQCETCGFTGNLPEWFGNLRDLQYLSLADNKFTGEVPVSFQNLESLEHLDVSSQVPRGGGLTGNLPDFTNQPYLSELYLNNNKLTGTISTSFLQNIQSESVRVDLRRNDISGGIPFELLGRIDDFTLLLANNKISDIPDEFCDDDFNKSWNNGDIMEFGCEGLLCAKGYYNTIGRKTDGDYFDCIKCDKDMDSEQFFGSTSCGVVEGKSQLEALYYALNGPDWNINDNWLEHDLICDWYGVECDEYGEKVLSINLEDNGLKGDVPPELFELKSLATLNLKGSDINFSFENIGKLSNLRTLKLSSTGLNSLDGIGNAQSLVDLHLTDNLLQSIPEELFELENLVNLYLNYNQIQGQLSPSIGKLSSLEQLFLFQNRFSGSIPSEVGDLKELVMLSLGMFLLNIHTTL